MQKIFALDKLFVPSAGATENISDPFSDQLSTSISPLAFITPIPALLSEIPEIELYINVMPSLPDMRTNRNQLTNRAPLIS